jgi:hypothetical protein
MMKVENNQLRVINEASGNMVKHEIHVHERSCTFDRLGTRFIIHVAKVGEREYIVSIPNFYFSIQTPTPNDIAYKLVERDVMSRVDGESVEMAIKSLMTM